MMGSFDVELIICLAMIGSYALGWYGSKIIYGAKTQSYLAGRIDAVNHMLEVLKNRENETRGKIK